MSGRDSRLDRLNQTGNADFWNHPPARWKNCPKLGDIIEDLFMPFKTPLDTRYYADLASSQRFSVEDVFDEAERRGKGMAAWLDLTKTKRFYQEQETSNFNAHPETKYMKIQCEGHEGAPDSEKTRLFIELCDKFIKPSNTHRRSIIGIHCTHGFNRTGFLICAYLVEKLDWSVEAAIDAFARCRPPGIYKDQYIKELYNRYEDGAVTLSLPQLPAWCYEENQNDIHVDDDGNSHGEGSIQADGTSSESKCLVPKNAKFMDGVPSVDLVFDPETIKRIRMKCKQYCRWNGDTFPGCQPVSMDNDNKNLLAKNLYDVSWKADGVRYMLFIECTDQAFFIDRNNDVFQVHGMHFPKNGNSKDWIEETLLDGEMIIDEQPNGGKRPRYLIYDIVHFIDEDVGNKNFRVRCDYINNNVIRPREEKARSGELNKDVEPFSIRWKTFYPVNMAGKLLGEVFAKQVSHEVDGLVFQPVQDPYIAGRCDKVLKWKPPEQCTVDFKLQVTKFAAKGMVPTMRGLLLVGGLTPPFGELKWSRAMKKYDKQILECSYDPSCDKWVFQRVRSDKSFPNHYTTANAVMKGIRNPLKKDSLVEFIKRHAVVDSQQQPRQSESAHKGSTGNDPNVTSSKFHGPAGSAERPSVIKRSASDTDSPNQRPIKLARLDEPRIY